MKKFFTLIAVLAMVINASADDWNNPAGGNFASGTVLLTSSDVEITSKYDAQATTWKDESGNDCPRAIGDVKYKTYVPLRAATAPSMFAPAGAENTGACVVIVKAINNVDVTFTYRRQPKDNAYVAGDGKDILCYNQVTKSSFVGTLTQLESTPAETDDYMHCSETFKLVAGVSYTFYALGTTLCLEQVSTAAGTTTETTPTSAIALPSAETVVWNCSSDATTAGATIGDLSFKFIEGENTWSFGKYAAPAANPSATSGSIEFTAAKSGRLFIMFAGNIATNKTINISPVLNSTVISTGTVVENGVNPKTAIASGDGIYYDILPGTYTFFVGGTKYRVSTIAFDNTVEVSAGIQNVATATASAKAKKYMQNGQLVIETAKGTFTAGGARVK